MHACVYVCGECVFGVCVCVCVCVCIHACMCRRECMHVYMYVVSVCVCVFFFWTWWKTGAASHSFDLMKVLMFSVQTGESSVHVNTSWYR